MPLDGQDPFITPCPSWCEDADSGHTVSWCQDDRTHFGPVAGIPLSLEKLDVDRTNGTVVVEVLSAYLFQNVRDEDEQIQLSKSGGDVARLTLDEGIVRQDPDGAARPGRRDPGRRG